jgi:hypothetical protein
MPEKPNTPETSDVDRTIKLSKQNMILALGKLLGHRFVAGILMLFFGTFVTYKIVPFITYKSKSQEIRLNKALAAVEYEKRVGLSLNAVLTRLEGFIKDTKGIKDSQTIKNEQKKLNSEVWALYQEFNSVAWWWPSQFEMESEILKINKTEVNTTLRDSIVSYKKNLIQATTVLDTMWKKLLRDSYRPEQTQDSMLSVQTRKSIESLCESRQKTVIGMGKLLAPKGFRSIL